MKYDDYINELMGKLLFIPGIVKELSNKQKGNLLFILRATVRLLERSYKERKYDNYKRKT